MTSPLGIKAILTWRDLGVERELTLDNEVLLPDNGRSGRGEFLVKLLDEFVDVEALREGLEEKLRKI